MDEFWFQYEMLWLQRPKIKRKKKKLNVTYIPG